MSVAVGTPLDSSRRRAAPAVSGRVVAAALGVVVTLGLSGCGESGKERALEELDGAPSGALRERLAQTQTDR